MEIVTGSTAANLSACVATIGCFDGVHRGHQYLIEQVHNIAKAEGLASCLITYFSSSAGTGYGLSSPAADMLVSENRMF